MNVVLPEGWPRALVPIPAGWQLVADESDADALRVRFVAAIEPGAAASFVSALSSFGWRTEPVGAQADGETDIEIEGHGFFGQIEIDAAGVTIQLVR